MSETWLETDVSCPFKSSVLAVDSSRYFIVVTLTIPKVCISIFSESIMGKLTVFPHVHVTFCRNIRPLLMLNGTSYTISWRRSTNPALKWCCQSCPLEMWPHNTLQTEICSVQAVLWRKILRELWWYDDILCLCCLLAFAVYHYFHDSILVWY